MLGRPSRIQYDKVLESNENVRATCHRFGEYLESPHEVEVVFGARLDILYCCVIEQG